MTGPMLLGAVLVLAVMAADWWFASRGQRAPRRIAKPAALLALIGWAVAFGATDSAVGWWLLVALVFGLAGDIFLLSKTSRAFQAGLAAFLVGHLAYAVCFTRIGVHPSWLWPAVAILVIVVGATRQVVPAVHRKAGPALSLPVVAYMGVIGMMLLAAWCTARPAIAVGATIFVVSDAVLSMDRFVRPWRWADLVVMVHYHLGQALIVYGVLA